MRYTLIGSGTVVPDARRGPAAHHFACGDVQVLCDLGSGTLRRLDGLGLRWPELDMVAVTHRHQDHTADLLPLLFALRHTPGVERVRPLTLLGYAGFARDLSLLSEVYGGWVLDPGFPLEVRESSETPLEIERGEAWLEIEARPVVHSPEAVGYRMTLSASGREVVVAYTGDTEESAEAIDLARDADLLVSECSVADEDRVAGHLTPRGVGRVAAAASVGRLVTTHFYPSALSLGPAEIERRIRESYAEGPVDLGVDGLCIDL
ncbi:MAG TPA: MBL fold metallo-hydrolase [Gemmatimonadota bacterium]|nr:MBL fold metallo-hydrolase [Gemmatimonadota bacterium]